MSQAQTNNMKERKRPLSPHLQIYRPQITSVMSILHRLTGIAIYFGMIVLAWWIVNAIYYASFGQGNTNNFLWGLFSTYLGKLMIFGWSIALFYHMFNGIRHLTWDAGCGYELNSVTYSGITVLVATFLAVLSSWALVLL